MPSLLRVYRDGETLIKRQGRWQALTQVNVSSTPNLGLLLALIAQTAVLDSKCELCVEDESKINGR